MVDVDVDGVYERRETEASMTASFNHFTISLLAKILHITTGYDFRFLATVL